MTATSIDDLKIKIFADGADLDGMKAMAAKPWIKGLTTNPTLMRKAGVTDYAAFAPQGAGRDHRQADLVRGVC